VLWRTVVAYLAVRVIEGWLMTPFVNRQVVAIPPALTLFTILGVGAVFGVYGVFFAGALLVLAFVGVREFYLRDTLGEDIEGVPRDERKRS
jgi:predicted PurR-regulated permease PerM